MVLAPTRERDLAGVAAQIEAALGEDEARPIGVAVQREQHRGVGPARRVHRLRLLGTQQDACEGVHRD